MRLPKDEEDKAEFVVKLLFVLFVFSLFILLPGVWSARADYQTGDTSATASTSQTLRLVILPALDVQTIDQSTESSPNEITTTLWIGLRANTAWDLSYSATSSSLSFQPICTDQGATGLRNEDDNRQLFTITCRQPLSWADPEGLSKLEINYEVQSALLG